MNGPSQEMREGLTKIIDLLHKSGYRLRFSGMNNLDPKLITVELEKYI